MQGRSQFCDPTWTNARARSVIEIIARFTRNFFRLEHIGEEIAAIIDEWGCIRRRLRSQRAAYSRKITDALRATFHQSTGVHFASSPHLRIYFEDGIIEPAFMTIHVRHCRVCQNVIRPWKLENQLCICHREIEKKGNHDLSLSINNL